MNDYDDALKGLTRRQLEELAAKVEKELRACVLCGSEGAQTYRIRPVGVNQGPRAAILFCRPCFEKHRVPEARAKSMTRADEHGETVS